MTKLTEERLLYWSRLKDWNLLEAVHLFHALDPIMLEYGRLDDLNEREERPMIETFNLLAVELSGSLALHGPLWRFAPMRLIELAEMFERPVPSELKRRCEEMEARRRDARDQAAEPCTDAAEDASFSRRRYNNMLKLIGAMAADHYGWTPGKQGSAPAEIEKLTDEFAAKVSDDTVRKILAEAAEQIDVASRFLDDPS